MGIQCRIRLVQEPWRAPDGDVHAGGIDHEDGRWIATGCAGRLHEMLMKFISPRALIAAKSAHFPYFVLPAGQSSPGGNGSNYAYAFVVG